MAKNQLDITVNDNIDFLIENEMVADILWTLAFHKSLNLKKISVVIDKKPASVLHNLKRLEKRDLIKLDSEATQKKQGKYYNTSTKGYELIEEHVLKFIEGTTDEVYLFTEREEVPDEKFFQKLGKMGRILSNYNKIMSNIRYNFLRYNAKEIKIRGDMFSLKGMNLRGIYRTSRVNIENPDRLKRLMEFYSQFNEEGKKLLHEFKDEDKLIFQKTGRNPDSLSDGKRFLHMFFIAFPMMVEELD